MASNNSDVGEYGLKALAEQIFGSTVVKILKDKKMSYRDIWELSSPTTQCANTIGDAIDGVSDCWLCGYKIDMLETDLRPECEHVLPVGQALVFLDLYKHTVHKGLKNPELIKMLKLEYRWSHSFCNRLKSDINFLSFNSKGKSIVLDDVITDYLETLYKNYYISGLVKASKTTRKDWINERLVDISKQLKLIVSFIDVKSQGLLLLSGIASLFEPENIAVSVRNTLRPDNIPNIEAINKSLSGKEFMSLRYFIEYKSKLTSQISELSGPLSRLLTAKIVKKDKSFINVLIEKYDLGRNEFEIAMKMYIMNIIKNNLAVPFDNIIPTELFKDLYLKYSYFKRFDLFNPFVLELIYMCVLCTINNDLSRTDNAKGAIDNDIGAIQQIWLSKCSDDDYKLFFCRMTDMFISSGVISKDIIKCVNRIDCSGTVQLVTSKTAVKIKASMWDDIIAEIEAQRDKAILEAEAEEASGTNASAKLNTINAATLLMGLKYGY